MRNTGEWKDFSVEQPTCVGEYLVATEYVILIAIYMPSHKKWSANNGMGFEYNPTVTHWMELPKMPRVKE